MRKFAVSTILVLSVLVASPGQAATTSVTGTIKALVVESQLQATAETVTFQMSVTPAATGCPANNGWFEIDPGSVSDPQTRKNMLTTLFAARTAGMTIEVVYDNAGAYCAAQFGYAIPIALIM